MELQPSTTRRFRRPTLVEGLVIVALIAFFVVLLLPAVSETKWAASGDIDIPVRVLVFDVGSGQPLPEARVTILYGGGAYADMDIEILRERLPEGFPNHEIPENSADGLPPIRFGQTGEDGIALVPFTFATSASNNRPEPHAYVGSSWAAVSAEGYGTVVVPLRYEFVPTAKLKEDGELFVTVGLMPVE